MTTKEEIARGAARGTSKAANKRLLSSLREQAKETDLDVTGTDAVLVGSVVLQLLEAGNAVTFGRTRDGRAISLVVFEGSDSDKSYYESVESFELALRSIYEALANG